MSAESNMLSPASRHTSTSRVAPATSLAPQALKNSVPPPNVPVPKQSTGTLKPDPPSCRDSIMPLGLAGKCRRRIYCWQPVALHQLPVDRPPDRPSPPRPIRGLMRPSHDQKHLEVPIWNIKASGLAIRRGLEVTICDIKRERVRECLRAASCQSGASSR